MVDTNTYSIFFQVGSGGQATQQQYQPAQVQQAGPERILSEEEKKHKALLKKKRMIALKKQQLELEAAELEMEDD